MSVKPSRSRAEWDVGSVIMGLYEVRQVFESGGMGLVYRIHHRGWDVDLAMKSPRTEFFRTEAQKRAFENEAETWMNLGLHPNTVSCFYVRRLEGIPRVFAEYIDGGNLREWIKGRKLLSLEAILDAAIQFARGIGYAHDQGLIHQDIKPANVMMTPEGVAKVTDFGLAKARMMSGEEPSETPGAAAPRGATDAEETIAAGTIRAGLMESVLVSCGGMTPAYCSPEQASHSPLSRKTDIWSWGLSVLEMFVGDVTWMSGQTAQLTLKNYLKNGPLDKRIPPMPEPLVELLRRCFEKDPDKRPANMDAITAALKDIYRETLLRDYPREEYRAGRDTADSLNNRAISYVDLGRGKDVDALWRQALKSDPHHLESTFNLVLHEWKKGSMDEDAVFVRMEGIRTAHASRRYHHLLGKLHMFFGGYARAVENLRKALEGTRMEAEETKDLVLALCAEGIKTEELAGVENSVRTTLWRDVEKLCAAIDAGGGAAAESSCRTTVDAGGHADVQTAAARALALKRMGRREEALAALGAPAGFSAASGEAVEAAARRFLPGCEGALVFTGHTERMRSAAFTPDGRHVLSGGEEAALYLWNLDTGGVARTLTGHTGFINSVFVSADGLFALSGGDDLSVRRWDLASGKCAAVYRGHTADVTCVRASSNGIYILSASNDATLRLWSVKNDKCLRVLKGHTAGITAAALAHDAYYALSAGNDRALILWNIITGKTLRAYKGFSSVGITSAAFSPDGRRFVCGMDDGSLALWNVDAEEPYAVFKTHDGAVTTAAFSPDGARLYSSGVDGSFRIRDAGGLRVYVFKGVEAGPFALSADGGMAAFAAWNGIRTLEISNTYSIPCAVSMPVSSAEAQEREGGFSERIERAMGLIETGAGNFSIGLPAEALALVDEARAIKGYERDAQALAAVERLSLILPRKEFSSAWVLKVFKGEGEAPGVSEGAAPRVDGGASIECAALSDDNKYIVSGDAGGLVTFRDAASPKILKTVKGHEGAVVCAAFQQGAATAVTGGRDDTARVWDASDGRLRAALEGHAGAVTCAALSRDGRFAVTGSADETLRLWDLMTGQCIRVFEGHQASVTAAALSPSGAILFSAAEEETLRLWDTFSGRCEAVLKTPNNVTTAAALSEDMRLALSAGLYDHTITVWDMESRKPIKALKGHTGRIVSVSFTPDGRFALSAAHDATVRLWDLENAQTPGVLKGHTAAVTSASLGGNALLAVSSSRDGTLRLWHLDWRLDAAGDFTEWDEGAAHCLRTFLDLRIPYLEDAMTRRGTPQWGEGDFKELLTELGRRGFGRIKPDGVLRKLRQMEAALEEARLKEEAAFNESVRAAEALIKAKDYAGAYAEVEKARLIAGYAREPRAMELSDKLLGVFARGGISAAWKLRTFKGHAGGIACAAAIQNCRYVLTGGEDGALNLWETASWKILRAFKGHAGAVTCAVVGPLERYAVTGGADASVRLWDLLTGKGLAVYKNHTQAVTSAAMTRNRRFILSGAADAGVCLTDITAGEPVYLFRGRAAGVTGLCFTPDDGTWLCAYADGVIHARDTATGALLFELSGHKQPVTCVRVTGDGRFALSASRDRTLRVWDIGRELSMDAGVDGGGEYPRKIKPQRVLDFRFGGVRSFAPGPDGRFFIAGDEYGRLLVVEAGGAAALDFRAHKGRINAVDVGRDGRIALSAGDDGSVCLWRLDWRPDIRPAADWDDGALPYIDRFAAQNQQAYSAQGGPDAAAFSENDLQGLMDDLSKGGCGWLRPDAVRKKAVERILLRAGRLKEERERFERAIKAAEEAVNSGDLKTALAAAVTASRVKGFERSEETLAAMGRLNLLLPKKAPAGSWKTGSLKGHTEGVSALAAGAGGLIAGGGEDGTVRLWDLKTGRCAHTITAHTEGVSALAFSADGRNVFSAGRDQVIRVWDTASGRAVDALEGHTGGVLALAASPDGRYLVSGGGDQTVRLWDTASLSASPQLTQGVASPTHGIASPAEKGRKCLKVLEGHIGSVTSASFTEDGWYVLTSGRDGAVCVWDVENAGMSGGRRILVMKGHHSGSVACAAVSPDMRYLASAGEDRTVRVYDALRGECIHVLKGHAGAVTAVTFSPDSRHLLSASEDRTMRLWECLSGRHEHTVEGHTAKIRAAIFAADGSTIISCGDEKNVLSWHIQWELEERAAGGWSDSVRPYLDTCVIRLMPNAKSVLTLQSKPRVENSDVERLAAELALRGFGWLGREALVLHLGETAAKWKEVLQRRRAWCSKLAGKA